MSTQPPVPAKYSPGDKVRLVQSDGSGVEYGVVACSWWDEQMRAWDCFITFYGDAPPNPEQVGQPDKPYVLRYYEASLTEGWSDPPHGCLLVGGPT